MELTQKQLSIINSQEPRIAVRAAAAAGKTTVLTEKVRKLIKDGVDPRTIAVITYTRMAAANLIERLGEDLKEGIYIGTIHGLAAHFLSKAGRGNEIGKVAEDEDFDKLFEKCKTLTIEKTYSWVLLDEAQDSTKEQLEFIFDMINPDCFFVVYDDRQTIYVEKNFLKFKLVSHNTQFYSLNENFRNGRSILSFAKGRLRNSSYGDDSIAMSNSPGTVIVDKFDESMLDAIRPGEYKDWAILTPQNKFIIDIADMLKKRGIPYTTFRQGSITKKQLDKIMNDDVVKVLTIHSSKGLEWPNVLVYETKNWMMFRAWYSKNLSYVAATRAKEKLYWTET